MIDLATGFLNFLRFYQSVFEFDFLDLRKSPSRFFMQHFISFVADGRLRLDFVVLQGT